MNIQAITVASGILLLIIFALVGWNLERKRGNEDQSRSKESSKHDEE